MSLRFLGNDKYFSHHNVEVYYGTVRIDGIDYTNVEDLPKNMPKSLYDTLILELNKADYSLG